ncbi:hypothetical protein PNOK_0843300 [Pyrrhoderma noxium]|uniref:Uncharacterized protein n=1 Tax=Pyrrhoderma noxium TaxID=2282107 RepID=A0A286U7N6_9AGAM|nr:hypothetical protein PNOK_0843300 [Pyrrhoderma noxium]
MSTTLCSNGELPGRPDIEGIGTRIATYAQVLLAIFTIAIQPAVRSFDAWWAVLVTSLGLQFAAIAHRSDLTLFHALVVSWLAFPIFAMSWVYIFVHWREREMPPEIMLATHVHGFLFIGYGLWVWSIAPSFGACPELNGSFQFVILGKSVNPLSWVRIFVLVLYSVWGVMFIMAALASTLKSSLLRRIIHPSQVLERTPRIRVLRSTQMLVLVTTFNLLSLALGIWHVETLLIRNETQSVLGDENSWTFGQIAAIILLAGPLFTFIRLLRLRLGLCMGNGNGDLGNDREGMPIRSFQPQANVGNTGEGANTKSRNNNDNRYYDGKEKVSPNTKALFSPSG